MVGLKQALGIVVCLQGNGRNGSTLLIAAAEVEVVGAAETFAGDLVVAVFGVWDVGRSAGDSEAPYLEGNRTRASPIPGDGRMCFVENDAPSRWAHRNPAAVVDVVAALVLNLKVFVSGC